ncbi:MAG TPA: hypothetical protein VK423_01015 [Thermoplasmata archaeon]|nr:hypothetical protein [Thermoplasmata archaeon]
MRLETTLFREAGEHPLPRAVAVPVPKPKGRPRVGYLPRVQSVEDVERWRRRGLPLALLTSDWVTQNGYPEKFRPLLFVYADLANQVQSRYRVVPVRDRDALREPGFEEFVTFLLKVDTLAARAVVLRNQGKYNPSELYRRVRNEGLERLATKVRLQEFVPGLPVVGEQLPEADLAWVERNNPRRTVSP